MLRALPDEIVDRPQRRIPKFLLVVALLHDENLCQFPILLGLVVVYELDVLVGRAVYPFEEVENKQVDADRLFDVGSIFGGGLDLLVVEFEAFDESRSHFRCYKGSDPVHYSVWVLLPVS